MKEEALKGIGLNEKEVSVFLACLRMGSSLVQDISKSSGLNRTSCYDILVSLENKGFVSYKISSGKRYYQAINPKDILGLLKEKEMLVRDSLSELEDLKKSDVRKPRVEVYVGNGGLKTLFESILNEADYFYTIASKKHLSNLFSYYFPHFVERRIKKKIKVKILTDDVPYDSKADYKLIKKPLKTATWIYNGKIVMVSLEEKEPIGVLIEEKNFYDTQKTLFEMLWENL